MGAKNFSAGGGVLLVGIPRTEASVFFDNDLVTALDELIGGRREEGDARLMGFHLAGNTDYHGLRIKKN